MSLPLWPFTPNWTDPVIETLEWLTDVLQSPSGAEQRRALRLAPRRSFSASVVVQGPERTLFDLWVHTRAGAPLALPVWPDVQWLLDPPTAGAPAIACRTAGFDFVDGGMAALVGDDPAQAELLQVATTDVDSLVLADPVTADWPMGTRLYPVRAARFAEQPTVARKADDVWVAQLHLELNEPCDWPPQLPATTYRNRPLLAARPDESQDLTRDYERLARLLDNTTGVARVTDTTGLGFGVLQHRFVLFGRAAQVAFRSLLYGLRGRQGACWIPTHAADLEPLIVSGSVLTVRRCGYADHAPMAPGRRDVRIARVDGSAVHRRITGAAIVNDETEALTLDGPVDTAASDITRVSFMQLARLAEDVVDISHVTDADGVATASVVWRALRDDLEEDA